MYGQYRGGGEQFVHCRKDVHSSVIIFLGPSQEIGRDSYLSTVSDTLLMRGVGPPRPVGGVLSSKHYTGEELSETQVSCR